MAGVARVVIAIVIDRWLANFFDRRLSRGPSMPSPGGLLSTPPLAEFSARDRSFGDNTLYCHVGRVWRGRVATGGQWRSGEPFLCGAY